MCVKGQEENVFGIDKELLSPFKHQSDTDMRPDFNFPDKI